MKKLIASVLILVCVLSISGCSQQQQQQVEDSSQQQQAEGNQLLLQGTVINVDISSLPEGYDYSFKGEDAQAITDYLSSLNLNSKFEENPNEYVGMTWDISLEYENGETQTIYHFGNMFIRAENGPWYKMSYEQAHQFDSLLNELNN